MAQDVYCCICGNSCKGCDFDYLHDEFEFNKINIDVVKNTQIPLSYNIKQLIYSDVANIDIS